MIIQLASCNKKKNSTLVNGIWNMTKECSLKNPTSVMTPVVTIYDKTDQMQRFNYAYIPDFGRYYFIDDIIFEDTGNVTLTMSIDVLASYRDEIITSDIYYLRSPYNARNKYIADGLYPLSTKVTTRKQTFHIPRNLGQYYPRTFDTGWYIIVTAGLQTATGTTGQTVYQLTPAQFKTMVNNVMAKAETGDWGDLPQGVKNAIFSPLDYVVACFWSPIYFQPTSVGQTVYLGRWKSDVSAEVITGAPSVMNYEAEVMQPFGVYEQPYRMQKPFSRFVVSLGFVADFEIDGSLIFDGDVNHQAMYIHANITIDPTTGIGTVQVLPAYQYNGQIYERNTAVLANIETQILVPVNLSTVKNNMIQAGSQAIGGIFQGLAGDVIGAIGSFINAGITTANAITTGGTISSVSPNGSLSKHYAEKVLIMQFFDVVGQSDDMGYPCCKLMKAVTGNVGYYQGMRVALRLSNATREETQLAEALIESGYFYQ